MFGGFNYVPRPGDYLQQHSLIRAANAPRGPVHNSVYAGNPNAYFNRIRDNGFVPSYDLVSRVPPAARSPRPASPGSQVTAPAPAATATAAVAPQPVIPLASFFDSMKQLVWPSDAPVTGDLRQKRDVSDAGCLAVLKEYQAQGRATVGSVTDSRLKLIAYGQPALEEIRTNATPRVADAFHLFLLSLYESLNQTANPPVAPAPATP
jgi:hypothetical protein